MKLAVYYYGLVRTLLHTIESHRQYLHSQYDCDIFFHFWTLKDSSTGWQTVTNVDQPEFSSDELQYIIDSLHPTRHTFESYKEKRHGIYALADKFDNTTQRYNAKNTISGWYSSYMSKNLVLSHMKETNIVYDAVLRIRPDTELLKSVEITIPEEKTVIIPNVQKFPINDQIALGTPITMDIYSNLYTTILDTSVNQTNYNLHPEKALERHLQKNDIKIVESNFIEYKLLKTITG